MNRILPLALLAAGALGLNACRSGSDTATSETTATEATGAGTAAAPAPGDSASGGTTAAGEDHAHKAPHGGTVKTAGGGHLEAVIQGRNLMIYALDGSEATLPVAGIAGAQVIVQPQSGDAVTLPLTAMGDHLMATLPEGMTAYTAIVTVPVAGETRSAQFEVGLDGDTGHAH